jgi:hypothetical protein
MRPGGAMHPLPSWPPPRGKGQGQGQGTAAAASMPPLGQDDATSYLAEAGLVLPQPVGAAPPP